MKRCYYMCVQPGVGHHVLGTGDDRFRRSAHPAVHGCRFHEYGQKLDFERFGNDMLLDFYKAERDAIAEICPDRAVHHELHGLHRPVLYGLRRRGRRKWTSYRTTTTSTKANPILDELACSDALRGFAGARQTVVRHGTFHLSGAVETAEHPQM